MDSINDRGLQSQLSLGHVKEDEGVVSEFAALHAEIARLQKQLDAMKPDVVEALDRLGKEVSFADGANSALVTVKLTKTTKWQYSDRVTQAESELKQLRQQDKADGLATSKVVTYPRVLRKEVEPFIGSESSGIQTAVQQEDYGDYPV